MATAQRRVKEAEATGATHLSTACPFCAQNFLDYISTSGSTLELVDVVWLLAQSVFGETERKKRGGRDAE
jgi:Fe-S oxidoreductase